MSLKLTKKIKDLSDNQLKSAVHLFNIMWYLKGLNKGNLLSPFLQNKALNFVNSSLYKVGQDSGSLILNNQKLQKQITWLEHSNSKKNTAQKSLSTNSQSLKQVYKQLLWKTNVNYTATHFINIAT